jgi:hypothetical protein
MGIFENKYNSSAVEYYNFRSECMAPGDARYRRASIVVDRKSIEVMAAQLRGICCVSIIGLA